MRFGVYIYVDGSDLHDVAEQIKRRLAEIATRFPQLKVVDDRLERTADMQPEDLPDWNLGLNFDLDRESASIVPSLLDSVRSVSRESGRNFAVGYYDRRSQYDQDIGFIEPDTECTVIARILESLAENG